MSKIYDINDKEIIESFLIDSNGAGHGALADLLCKNKVDLLVCGGIGNGAVNALSNFNINTITSANGQCDDIIKKFINNELELSNQSNCDHHNHHHDDNHECHCESEEKDHKHNCSCR